MEAKIKVHSKLAWNKILSWNDKLLFEEKSTNGTHTRHRKTGENGTKYKTTVPGDKNDIISADTLADICYETGLTNQQFIWVDTE